MLCNVRIRRVLEYSIVIGVKNLEDVGEHVDGFAEAGWQEDPIEEMYEILEVDVDDGKDYEGSEER